MRSLRLVATAALAAACLAPISASAGPTGGLKDVKVATAAFHSRRSWSTNRAPTAAWSWWRSST